MLVCHRQLPSLSLTGRAGVDHLYATSAVFMSVTLCGEVSTSHARPP